jgi:DNA-binding CsgD family transcriptional regulator
MPALAHSRVMKIELRTIAPLTATERWVVTALIEGKSRKEMAHELGTSVKTIDTYQPRARRKIGARNMPEMIRIALLGE